MDVLTVVRAVAVVCIGLMAGIFLGYRAGPYHALQELPSSTFVQFQRVVHLHFMRFMPPLVLTALVATFAWLWILRLRSGSLEFWLTAASAGTITIIAGLTRAISVPLNNQLMTWDVASPPVDLRAKWSPWDRVNTIRAILATGVLILEAVTLSLSASSVDP